MKDKRFDALFFVLMILLAFVGLCGLAWFICDYVNGAMP
jgi:hypothetical protein